MGPEVIGGDDRTAPAFFVYRVSIDHYVSGGNVYDAKIGGRNPHTWPTRAYPLIFDRSLKTGRPEKTEPPAS